MSIARRNKKQPWTKFFNVIAKELCRHEVWNNDKGGVINHDMMDTRKIMDLNNITYEFDLSAMENQPLCNINVISALQDDDEKTFKSIATKGAKQDH